MNRSENQLIDKTSLESWSPTNAVHLFCTRGRFYRSSRNNLQQIQNTSVL